MNPNGDAVAIWWNNDDASHPVIQSARRPAGGAFGAAETLSDPTGSSILADVAIDAAGGAVAVWADASAILASVRSSGGPWGAPVTLAAATSRDSNPRVAMDAAGDAVVIWYHQEFPENSILSALRPAGGDWAAPVRLSDVGRAPGFNGGYTVTMNAGGDAVAAWADAPTGGSTGTAIWTVRAALKLASGPFGAAETAGTIGTWQGSPAGPTVAMSSAGDVLVGWQKPTTGQFSVARVGWRPAGGPFAPEEDLGPPDSFIGAARVAMNGSGDAAAAWMNFGTTSGPGGHDVASIASRPPQGSFGTSAPLTPADQEAAGVDIAIGEGGDAIAGWYRTTASGHAVEAALRPSGAAFGATTVLSDPVDDASGPHVERSADGDAVAVWSVIDGSTYRVQAALFAEPPPQDNQPPTSQARAPALTNQTTIPVTFDAGDPAFSAGLDRVELWVKGPRDGAFGLAATAAAPGPTGSFAYVATQGDGNYLFQTLAADKASHIEAAPGVPDATTLLDTTPPVISIAAPADGSTITLKAKKPAKFDCSDPGGSGLAPGSCVGTVANGSPFSTAKLGTPDFTVSAADLAGNRASRTHRYTVRPKPCGGLRRFNIHLLVKGKLVRSVKVTVRGIKQRVRTLRPRPEVDIDLRKLPQTTTTVRITVRLKSGRRLTGKRVYHPCESKLPDHGFKL